jgi:hypothetical protein
LKPELPLRPALPPPLVKLLVELEADHAFGEEVVAPFRKALVALDREADGNHDALQMLQAFSLIAAQPRPARDRFEDIAKIVNLPKGPTTVTIVNAGPSA